MPKLILGIDEVGRGPWAGPLLVGAVILGEAFTQLPEYDELTDSKKLTASKRERLATIITDQALAVGLGWVTASEIDRYGLSPSLKLAARRAVKQVLTKRLPFTDIVIDGTINLLADTPLVDRVTLLKKADLLVKEVSAASIVAKVTRDHYMAELAQQYPGYGFEKHVGYGTAQHQTALRELGVCPEHRRSFKPVKALLAAAPPPPASPAAALSNTTSIGRQAESAVAHHLEQLGHEIIARNYRTKSAEIDLISTHADKIYFTEVKYRHLSVHGTALEQVTADKRRRMEQAAKRFMMSQRCQLQPILAVAEVEGSPQPHSPQSSTDSSNLQIKSWFPLPE